ncbi:MAG: hypothetical protein SFU98_04615 [Leptospiraceae bacterium]|nr:hypothetical protein [Leptospiraceae bacterium]
MKQNNIRRNEGFKSLVTEYFKDISKGLRIGLGILIMLGTGALVAVAVTGTMNTFSSGQVLDATAMNTNFNSLKTAIEGIPNQKAMRLIYENDITSATTSVNITGLDGDSDVSYDIVYKIISSSGLPINTLYLLRPNSDATSSNYGFMNISMTNGHSGTASALNNNTQQGFLLSSPGNGTSANSIHFGKAILLAKTGSIRTLTNVCGRYISNTDFTFQQTFGTWTGSGNIVNLQFVSDQSNGIGAGSRIEVWARR